MQLGQVTVMFIKNPPVIIIFIFPFSKKKFLPLPNLNPEGPSTLSDVRPKLFRCSAKKIDLKSKVILAKNIQKISGHQVA